MLETWVQSVGWEDFLEKRILQCSCLEKPMDRGTWWATVHGVAKSQTQLNNSHNLHPYSVQHMPPFTLAKARALLSGQTEVYSDTKYG